MSAKPKGLENKAAILAYAKELGVSVELGEGEDSSRIVIFGPDKEGANLSLWDEAKHPRDDKGRFGSGGKPPGSPGERPAHSVVMSSSDTLFFTPTSRKSYPQMSKGFNHDDPAYAYGSYSPPLKGATEPPWNRPELALQGFADDPTPQLRSRVKELYPELEILRYNQRDYGLSTGKKLSGTGTRYKSREMVALRLWEEAKHPRGKDGKFGHGGESGSKDSPFVTSDVSEAYKRLAKGEYVELEQPRQISTLLDKLADEVHKAQEHGEKAPSINLCKVSVAGTNLFCAKSQGISRLQMPQFGGVPLEGSKADSLPRNERGRVDIGPLFREHLEGQGHEVTNEREGAAYLKATQNELDGNKVAALADYMTKKGSTEGKPLFISNDNYILDGHHRWAAIVGVDYRDGVADISMPVQRVDLPITTLLGEARSFAEEWGLPQVSLVQLGPTHRANPFTDLRLWSEAKHPRDTHGRFGHNSTPTIREMLHPISRPDRADSKGGSPKWEFWGNGRTIQAQLVRHENTVYIGGGAAPAYRHALVKFFNRELPDVAKIVYEDTLGGRKTYVLWYQKPKTSAKLSVNPFTEFGLWDEAKHPRDDKGRFGHGSASSTATITPAHAAARKRTQDARAKNQQAARKQEAQDAKTKTPLYMTVHYHPRSNLAPQAGVALQSIDKVHTDGVLPDLDVHARALGAENARYLVRSSSNREASIDVDPDKEAPALALVHEIGHFVDQQALGNGLKFASTDQFTREAPVRNLMQTLDNSGAIRTLQDMKDNPQDHKVTVPDPWTGEPTEVALPKGFLDYMLEPREQFARAYSQYIATKADNPVLDRQLTLQRDKWNGSQAGTPFSIPFQWQDKDFEPISGAFDALFDSRGWLR